LNINIVLSKLYTYESCMKILHIYLTHFYSLLYYLLLKIKLF